MPLSVDYHHDEVNKFATPVHFGAFCVTIQINNTGVTIQI